MTSDNPLKFSLFKQWWKKVKDIPYDYPPGVHYGKFEQASAFLAGYSAAIAEQEKNNADVQ